MKIIDLTLPIYDQAPSFPGDPECRIEKLLDINHAGYNLTSLSFSAHQGTHIDLPRHFSRDGVCTAAISLEQCMGQALKADLSSHSPEQKTVISQLENLKNEIKAGDILLIETGWDEFYGQKKYYTDFPGISIELANWLVDKKIKLLGIDMPNLNSGSEYAEIHKILLQNDILIVEGLANLKAVSADRFYFLAWPLPIIDGDGSPVRAAAIED